ncbi:MULTISPECIES: hypothetical protein [Halobacterium]|uniref:hypothetical protein n=1 Tax=Halobacterium TaxID=2239 RepID=UPI00073E4CC8|nr:MULTISPECIES: hypothetical protein [Halobacterium]MCG1004150.1 hypothetical protein [Halobacterium noricense]
MHQRERAGAVVAALAAVGVAVLFDAPPVVLPQIGVLYAAAGYYTARHPDVVRSSSDRPSPDWTAGALGGGLAFGLVGLTAVDAPLWLYVYGFGLATFGFAVGVAWARAESEDGA